MKTVNALSINQLELDLFLGWPDEERQRQQTIMLDIVLQTPTPPNACITDNLDDTVCYQHLIKKLREHFVDIFA